MPDDKEARKITDHTAIALIIGLIGKFKRDVRRRHTSCTLMLTLNLIHDSNWPICLYINEADTDPNIDNENAIHFCSLSRLMSPNKPQPNH
jgi:hypothetical protein